ncbi:DUF6418 domain-containing protein [[Mannheimia] succiniciproducens]|uniref:DUF6418 domain-containing protein n=1 Tax=Mannheimia succiniciproducens (strain KCTC 0769BP / MBEL55E) TaxID=221988 RepID=Q65UU3_MANSM|nr:DUF6418 domain-containing protein [[Mannheimia] succiniciproducens]AAU37267.1 unknown [[Mannheimia] succiniciproducens MBEL55E]
MASLRFLKFLLIIIFLGLCIVTIDNIFIVSDFVLFGIFLFLLFLEVIINPKRNFINSLVLLAVFLNILGVFAIEHSEGSYYLYEVEQWITEEGSIPLLLIYQFFFLQGVFLFVQERKIENWNITNIHFKSFFILSLTFLLLLTFGLIAKYSPAPVLRVDRFVYDKEILGKFGQITNILFYYSLGLGILYFKEKKKIYLFLLFFIELAFLLKGHKFWNLIEILFLFLIPYTSNIIRAKVISLILAVGSVMTLFIVAAISINVYYFPSFDPVDYARQRLSQEGQLWWSTYKGYEPKLRTDELYAELKNYTNLDEYNQYDIGMYKVMRLNTTPERFEWKLDKLSRYVYSTPPLLYYYLGAGLGILGMFLLGMAFSFWGNLLIYTINRGDLFLSLIVSRFFYIFRKAAKDGDIYKFFSIEFMLLILISLSFYIFYKYKDDLYKRKSLIAVNGV